ncbi:protoheme IX farnesyltransferase [Arthrobacter livingstonensis]|uniref:Protoheme IX farnesyltransferase n=1 Tax=Arthrobacter livingstonensis TaxID=670078 RepID=A0A2V5L586_9MICC|nr:heme o synthase [Arthrobacter livingstonensis]PYI64873.1 protoheme IX farnesyltransferase [Arthrobacter livingstonensis]
MAAPHPTPPPRRLGGNARLDGTDSALAARATGSSWRDAVLRYYSLAKPGVLYGNVLTAAAGFLFASPARVDWLLFMAVCAGTTLVIGSACVLNNILDRDIDAVMARTRKRATVTGRVEARNAVLYSVLLGVAGVAVLATWTNPLVVAVGLGGYLAYVVLYGMLSKRLSVHGTLVGSISGAAPVLGGYVGASSVLDAGAAIVFLMLFFWQLPAFYSISIYRRDEYAKAGVPVIAVVRGVANTKVQILLYTMAFAAVALLPQPLGLVGWSYSSVMGVLCLGWIVLGVRGLAAAATKRWARLMFRYALLMMTALSVLLAVGPRLP